MIHDLEDVLPACWRVALEFVQLHSLRLPLCYHICAVFQLYQWILPKR